MKIKKVSNIDIELKAESKEDSKILRNVISGLAERYSQKRPEDFLFIKSKVKEVLEEKLALPYHKHVLEDFYKDLNNAIKELLDKAIMRAILNKRIIVREIDV